MGLKDRLEAKLAKVLNARDGPRSPSTSKAPWSTDPSKGWSPVDVYAESWPRGRDLFAVDADEHTNSHPRSIATSSAGWDANSTFAPPIPPPRKRRSSVFLSELTAPNAASDARRHSRSVSFDSVRMSTHGSTFQSPLSAASVTASRRSNDVGANTTSPPERPPKSAQRERLNSLGQPGESQTIHREGGALPFGATAAISPKSEYPWQYSGTSAHGTPSTATLTPSLTSASQPNTPETYAPPTPRTSQELYSTMNVHLGLSPKLASSSSATQTKSLQSPSQPRRREASELGPMPLLRHEDPFSRERQTLFCSRSNRPGTAADEGHSDFPSAAGPVTFGITEASPVVGQSGFDPVTDIEMDTSTLVHEDPTSAALSIQGKLLDPMRDLAALIRHRRQHHEAGWEALSSPTRSDWSFASTYAPEHEAAHAALAEFFRQREVGKSSSSGHSHIPLTVEHSPSLTRPISTDSPASASSSPAMHGSMIPDDNDEEEILPHHASRETTPVQRRPIPKDSAPVNISRSERFLPSDSNSSRSLHGAMAFARDADYSSMQRPPAPAHDDSAVPAQPSNANSQNDLMPPITLKSHQGTPAALMPGGRLIGVGMQRARRPSPLGLGPDRERLSQRFHPLVLPSQKLVDGDSPTSWRSDRPLRSPLAEGPQTSPSRTHPATARWAGLPYNGTRSPAPSPGTHDGMRSPRSPLVAEAIVKQRNMWKARYAAGDGVPTDAVSAPLSPRERYERVETVGLAGDPSANGTDDCIEFINESNDEPCAQARKQPSDDCVSGSEVHANRTRSQSDASLSPPGLSRHNSAPTTSAPTTSTSPSSSTAVSLRPDFRQAGSAYGDAADLEIPGSARSVQSILQKQEEAMLKLAAAGFWNQVHSRGLATGAVSVPNSPIAWKKETEVDDMPQNKSLPKTPSRHMRVEPESRSWDFLDGLHISPDDSGEGTSLQQTESPNNLHRRGRSASELRALSHTSPFSPSPTMPSNQSLPEWQTEVHPPQPALGSPVSRQQSVTGIADNEDVWMRRQHLEDHDGYGQAARDELDETRGGQGQGQGAVTAQQRSSGESGPSIVSERAGDESHTTACIESLLSHPMLSPDFAPATEPVSRPNGEPMQGVSFLGRKALRDAKARQGASRLALRRNPGRVAA